MGCPQSSLVLAALGLLPFFPVPVAVRLLPFSVPTKSGRRCEAGVVVGTGLVAAAQEARRMPAPGNLWPAAWRLAPKRPGGWRLAAGVQVSARSQSEEPEC